MNKTFLLLFLLTTKLSPAQFGPKITVDGSGDWNYVVHGADLDGDGDIEFLGARSSTFCWYDNLGGGIFSNINFLPYLSTLARDIEAADIDNDGDLDIVACGSSAVGWLENFGGGSFATSWNLIDDTWSVINSISSLEVADFDGDNDLDIICTGEASHNITWSENIGGGIFNGFIPLGGGANISYAKSVDIADMDNDGDIDIVGGGYNSIKYFENLGGGNFSFEIEVLNGLEVEGVESVSLHDIDGDGLNDILGASYVDEEIFWIKNFGDSTFSDKIVLVSYPTLYMIRPSINAMDIDGDGDKDVFYTMAHTIRWLENLGGANFGPEQLIGYTTEATSITFSDLSGNGHQDVLISAYDSDENEFAWFPNMGTAGLIQDHLSSTYDKYLIKIIDLMGRVSEDKTNTVLIYTYSDGTTEKVFRIE